MYGVGARLDDEPGIFFMLRNINLEELISETVSKKTQTLLEKSKAKGRRVIDETDISDLFGIDIEVNETIVKKKASRTRVNKSAKNKQ
ncbi:hypothetical protein [Clostridium arbusti]|uniref:hypothetical protein n=1 Tax=Clostridium arbusti TaxID=1137848 RepID=UPI000289AF3D|nr:hypothetical protein [Clostridium arbusti]